MPTGTLPDGVLRSFLFGATLAAAVGPIALLIINYGLVRGFRVALARVCRDPAWQRGLNGLSGLAIAGFGLYGLVR